MTGYLLRRALHALLVLLIVTLVSFLLIHLVPGDPVRITLGAHAPPEAVAARPAPARPRPLARRAVRLVPRRAPARRPRHVDQPPAAGAGHRRPADLAEHLPARLRHAHLAARRGAARRSSRPSTGTARPTTGSASSRRSASRCRRSGSRSCSSRCSACTSTCCPSPATEPASSGICESLTLPAITVGIYLAPLIIRTLRVEPDRDALRGLRHVGARARLPRDARRREARAPERADRDDHDPRDQHRLPDQRHRRDRERVRDPGARLAARLVDPDARLPHDLGADAASSACS